MLFYSFFFFCLITDHMMVPLSHRTASTEYGCELEKDGEKRDILKCIMWINWKVEAEENGESKSSVRNDIVKENQNRRLTSIKSWELCLKVSAILIPHITHNFQDLPFTDHYCVLRFYLNLDLKGVF